MQVIVDELVTEYEDNGQGPVVLMLHGWGQGLRQFDALCDALSGVHVVRLDLPGFGKTERPHEAWDVSRYAGFVASFCRKINIRPSVIVGHSMGGRIIIKGLASKQLEAQRVVLIASAGVARRSNARTILFALIAKIGKALMTPLPRAWYFALRKRLYQASGSDYMSVDGMSDTFLRIVREDLSKDAAHITVPALIVWGAKDSTTPLVEGERLHTLIPDSRLVVIPHGTHMVHAEYAHEVAKNMLPFIV